MINLASVICLSTDQPRWPLGCSSMTSSFENRCLHPGPVAEMLAPHSSWSPSAADGWNTRILALSRVPAKDTLSLVGTHYVSVR